MLGRRKKKKNDFVGTNNRASTETSLWLILVTVFLTTPLSIAFPTDVPKAGSGSFVFRDKLGNRDKPITVWYHRPEALSADSPVLFVMHGTKRNGKAYRDAWIDHAEQYQFLLIVPEFSREDYRGTRRYNLGNMFSSTGKRVAKAKWTYTAIEHIFDHVTDAFGIRSENYLIYGHSAGAQFVHRLVLFRPDARIRGAVSANAGWYTMPTFRSEYPYGLKASGATGQSLKQAFSQQLLILLGEKDIDEHHKYLRKTPEAMAQGKHRLQRGHTFYGTAQRESKRLGAHLNWKIKVVRGVGHSNRGMAKEAARLLFGGEAGAAPRGGERETQPQGAPR